MNHAGMYQHEIWSRVLNLDNQNKKTDIFHQLSYEFYYQIRTDGFSCCLLFIHKEYQNRTHGWKNVKGSAEKDKDENEEFTQLTDLSNSE